MTKKIIYFIFCTFLTITAYGQTEVAWNDTSYFIEGDQNFNLIMSASKGHLSNVENLLREGADINAVTIDNISSLMYATENGDFEMVRFLLEKGADPDLKPFNGITALISAARLNYIRIAEFLVNNGANINAADEEGITAIHYAAAYNFSDLVGMLLYYDADPNKADRKGNIPIVTAAYNNALESIKVLVKHEVSIDDQDREGFTPLMVSIQRGNRETTEYLLENGADIRIKNQGNMTALAFAVEAGNYDLADTLIRKGADVNHMINKSLNILELAKGNKNDEIVELLEAADAKSNVNPGFQKMGIGPGLQFNGNDFMTSVDLELLESKYNTGINAGFAFRPTAVRILTEPENDTLYQYWERRYLIYAGLEKRFAIIKPDPRIQSGPFASMNAAYSFGGYRGSSNKPDGILKPDMQLGWYYQNNLILLKLSYNYLDFKVSNISPHRFCFNLLFTFNTTKKSTKEKTIPWLINE